MELRKSKKKCDLNGISFSMYVQMKLAQCYSFFCLFCMHEKRPSSFGTHAILMTVPISSLFRFHVYAIALLFLLHIFIEEKINWIEHNIVRDCVRVKVSRARFTFFRVILFWFHMFFLFWYEIAFVLCCMQNTRAFYNCNMIWTSKFNQNSWNNCHFYHWEKILQINRNTTLLMSKIDFKFWYYEFCNQSMLWHLKRNY